MSSRPVSKRLVLGEFVALGVSYAIVLGILLFALPDLPAGQGPSLAVGFVLFAVSYVVLFRLMAGTHPGAALSRPWGYSIPLLVGIVAGLAWIVVPRDPAAPDVATYAGAVPLLIAGEAISSLWWSRVRMTGTASPVQATAG